MLAYGFILLTIVLRVLLRPLAFAPVGAALLFFGARVPRKQMWVPLTLLAATDVYLTIAGYGYPFTADTLVTWGWYAAVLWIAGAALKGKPSVLRLGAAALATSVSFFVLSNFAVWMVWDMYPKTLGGLAACYVAAIPFFRNQVISDLVFTAVFFGLPAGVEALRGAWARHHASAA